MYTHSSSPSRRLIMSALVASGLTSLSSAVSLSNFTPRIENLPSTCMQVYTREIAGCQASDFPSQTQRGTRCSESCVNGLIDIARQVQAGCANVQVPDESIIGVFLLGLGVPAVCPGVQVTTITPSQSATQAPQSSRQPQPPQPQPSSEPSSDDDETTTTTTEAAQTTLQTSASSATSTGGIVIDTSVPTNAQPPPRNTEQPANGGPQPSPTASSQKSNEDSGGGSPFDVQATGSAPKHQSSKALTVGAMLGAVAIVFFTM